MQIKSLMLKTHEKNQIELQTFVINSTQKQKTCPQNSLDFIIFNEYLMYFLVLISYQKVPLVFRRFRVC